jgi:hypothetical protein
MVLECGALLPVKAGSQLVPVEVAHEVTLPVARDAVAQDVVVHPAADVDRVDLDVAVVLKRRPDPGRRGVDKVGAPQEATRLPGRDLDGPVRGPAAGRAGGDLGAGPAGAPVPPAGWADAAGARSARISWA